MRTEMHDNQPYSIRVVSARKVVFNFDLAENENLRDPEVVQRSMAGYMLTYPNVETYEALYLNGWLVLTVVGTIKPSTVDTYL